MAKYSLEYIDSKEQWEKYVLSRNPKSFLQSWAWGETNEKIGSKIFRLGFKKNGVLIGVCLLIKEQAKRGPHLIIPGGPIMNWEDKPLVSLFIKTVKDLAIHEKVWFIRIRPEIISSPESLMLFKSLGFVSAPMHLHAENTWVLDITKSEEDLLAGMRKSTRYLIKKSLNSGLTLEISRSPEAAVKLYKLQGETMRRHGFVGFSEKLFRSEISAFARDGNVEVFICKREKDVLAVAIIIFYGDTAYYHFSGSTSDFRQLPFSYFLQWQVIHKARERGIKYYNFWGIAPNVNPHHRFAGVTLFKTGFGGERTDWLHAHDLPVSSKYGLTFVFETLRRITRKL